MTADTKLIGSVRDRVTNIAGVPLYKVTALGGSTPAGENLAGGVEVIGDQSGGLPLINIVDPDNVLANRKTSIKNSRIVIPNRVNVRKVMATPPTITSAAAPTLSGQQFSASPYNYPVYSSATADCFTFYRAAIDPSRNYVNNVLLTAAPTYTNNSLGIGFFHEGANLELWLNASVNPILIKVDDQYVTLTPTNYANNFVKLAFGSAGYRRIDIIGGGGSFGFFGVMTDATDTITRAPVRGPRTIVIGDSFSAGSGGSGSCCDNFATIFGEAMGWDDIWCSGVGGTGYLATNAGAALKYRDRILHDVIGYAPEVVIVQGSINDGQFTAAQVGAEANLLYAALKLALPNALIVVVPTAYHGVGGMTTLELNIKQAMKTAAAAQGVTFLDVLEKPLPSYIPSSAALDSGTVLTYTRSPGDTSVVTGFSMLEHATYDIGGTERVQIKTNSGANGLQGNTASPLQYAHAIGETITRAGGSYLTGTGYVGSTKGDGNCDVLVGTDGKHPSSRGHVALGMEIANLFIETFGPN